MQTTRHFSSDADIIAIGRGLCERTLPKQRWTHAAHFAATLWLLSERGYTAVTRDLPDMIRKFNVHTGVENNDFAGYHETITQASIRAAYWFAGTREGAGLCACCNALMASSLGHPSWLLAYWSRERLSSALARREWLEPDLGPLPF